MSYETLVVKVDGPVGWISFNRPDVGNAMNAPMFDELARAWIALDADPTVRAIVITGEGKAFNTGLDVVSLARDPGSLREIRREMREHDMHFTARHQRVTKPVIAAVNGVCAGGGLQFVADSDLAICSSNASFFDPHVSVGQTVGYSVLTFARTLPFGVAMRLALTGRHERLSAQRAYEVGLVGEVVHPPDRLREAAQGLAELIALNSPAAVALSKRSMWRTLQMGLDDACRAGSLDIVEMWSHPDQEEGPAAFAEKREPRWQAPTTGAAS